AFDLRAVSLQRTGRLGTYATSLGQEAVAIGIASVMRPEDVLLPSYRDNAALILRKRTKRFLPRSGGYDAALGRSALGTPCPSSNLPCSFPHPSNPGRVCRLKRSARRNACGV